MIGRSFRVGLTTLILFVTMASATTAAETVRLGVSRLASCAPIAIALAKGYFTAEGIEPRLTFFDSQVPVAVAVTSGDLDVGIAAETAALYSLASGGKLKIIGGGASEAPSFHYLGLVASNAAYAAGLRSPRDLGGHSFALTQMGTGLQYDLGQLAETFGFDIKSVRIMPLQSNSNVASALAGGRVDFAIFNSTGALPLLAKGDAKLVGWIGDLISGIDQAYLFFASSKVADERPDMVRHLLAAFRKATRDYHDAFADDRDRRKDGPTARDTLDIIAKYLGQPPDQVEQGLPYFDADARVDVTDIDRQIGWYRAQGLLKSDVTAAQLVDMRYVIERTDPK